MAKTYAHPDYPTLLVIEAQSAADKPVPGAFFVTHQTVVLSEIAKRTYGMPSPPLTMLSITKRINRSKYNMQKCIYRYDSSNCYSSRVNGSQAANTNSWGPGAWLSLCNIDKAGQDGLGAELGTRYQIIWIPTVDGKEPWEVAVPVEPKPPVTVPGIPNVVVPPKTPSIPGIDIGIHVEAPKNGEPEVIPDDPDEPSPEPQKAGMGWIPAVVLGGAALITVIVFAARKKKKKGKK